jgi:hypothetical protein
MTSAEIARKPKGRRIVSVKMNAFLGVALMTAVLGNAQHQAAASREKNQPTAIASPQQLFKRLAPSVFVVEALDEKGSVVATGSGVALRPDLVATNKHVIDAGVLLRLRQGSRSWSATLSYLDPDHDLCGLKAENAIAPPPPPGAAGVLAVASGAHLFGLWSLRGELTARALVSLKPTLPLPFRRVALAELISHCPSPTPVLNPVLNNVNSACGPNCDSAKYHWEEPDTGRNRRGSQIASS